MEQIGLAASAADHRGCIRARRDADQNALLRSVELLDALPPQVGFELMIDHVGGQHQRNLAELRKVMLLFDVARDAIFRRRVHQFDLIGGADEGLRHRILNRLAADRLDLRLPLLHVLQIDRSHHRNAGSEQILDILPALRVLAAGRIAVSQAVDQADLRVPAQHGFDVDRVDPVDDARRNHFQAAEQFLDDGGLDRLRGRDHDILAARSAAGAPRRTCGRICRHRPHSRGKSSDGLAWRGAARLPPAEEAVPGLGRRCSVSAMRAAGVNYPPYLRIG